MPYLRVRLSILSEIHTEIHPDHGKDHCCERSVSIHDGRTVENGKEPGKPGPSDAYKDRAGDLSDRFHFTVRQDLVHEDENDCHEDAGKNVPVRQKKSHERGYVLFTVHAHSSAENQKKQKSKQDHGQYQCVQHGTEPHISYKRVHIATWLRSIPMYIRHNSGTM